MKSIDGEIAAECPVGEILGLLAAAAANVLVEDYRRELRRGEVAERASSASSDTE